MVQNETGGTPTESKMHTGAGPRASFANSSQMIAARAVGSLLELSATERASITTLTKAELQEADTIMVAAGKVWDCIVRRKTVTHAGKSFAPVGTAADALATLGPLLAVARLTEADDLRRMFAFRDFRDELRAAKTGALVERRASLALLTDAEMLGRATPAERPRLAKGPKGVAALTPAQRGTLAEAVARREVFAEIAGHGPATGIGIEVADIKAYYHGGALDRFLEDQAAWQRLAISRPPVGVGHTDDQALESRVKAAAEAGGGFRLSRLNMHSHLASWLAEHPDATDEQVASEAAFHNFGSHKGASAAAYEQRILANFPKIRAARAAGTPIHRGADTGAAGTVPPPPRKSHYAKF